MSSAKFRENKKKQVKTIKQVKPCVQVPFQHGINVSHSHDKPLITTGFMAGLALSKSVPSISHDFPCSGAGDPDRIRFRSIGKTELMSQLVHHGSLLLEVARLVECVWGQGKAFGAPGVITL